MGFDPYASPPYLVMEYVAGSSLRPLISEGRISLDDAVAIMKQVLAGLSHAHKNNVIHRDIKPENILVDERAFRDGFNSPGVVKVTDFGLGKAATHTAVGSIVYSQSLGDANSSIAGTLDYMSPEARAGQGDHRIDIYSCGVVLYELLTGHRPAGMEAPSDLNPNVPKQLDEIFKRAYARLEKRFTSADEMIEALSVKVTPPPLIKPPPLVARTPYNTTQSRPPQLPNDVCAHCQGKGIEPGAEWGFCDMCHGRGSLEGTDVNGHRIDVKCGICRGSGTKPPAKCGVCNGRGRASSGASQPTLMLANGAAAPANARASCPQCKQHVESTDQFCIYCGFQLVNQVRRCQKCGAYPDLRDQFCIFCGETLGSEVRV
jgi:hypothetical protein